MYIKSLSNAYVIFYLFSDNQLKMFFDSMRTRYGRLTNSGKSGQGSKELTERDQFVLDNFGFLKDHIRRCPPRSNTKVVSIIKSKSKLYSHERKNKPTNTRSIVGFHLFIY